MPGGHTRVTLPWWARVLLLALLLWLGVRITENVTDALTGMVSHPTPAPGHGAAAFPRASWTRRTGAGRDFRARRSLPSET